MHRLFYYPYSPLTDPQPPLLKVAALYFEKLIILDPVGARRTTVGADHVARDADGLAKYAGPVTEAIRRDMADREFLKLCDAQAKATGKQIGTKTGAELIGQLADAAKARDAWLGTTTTRSWLKAAGITVGAASAVLAVVAGLVTRVALAIAGLGIVSDSAIRGAEWLLDWGVGKKRFH